VFVFWYAATRGNRVNRVVVFPACCHTDSFSTLLVHACGTPFNTRLACPTTTLPHPATKINPTTNRLRVFLVSLPTFLLATII
jgi:hypothetical protein